MGDGRRNWRREPIHSTSNVARLDVRTHEGCNEGSSLRTTPQAGIPSDAEEQRPSVVLACDSSTHSDLIKPCNHSTVRSCRARHARHLTAGYDLLVSNDRGTSWCFYTT